VVAGISILRKKRYIFFNSIFFKKINIFEDFFLNKDNLVNIYYNQYKSYEMDYFITDLGDLFPTNDLVTITYSKFGLIEIKNSVLNDSLEIVRRRVDEVGTKEPTIIRRGNDRILIELPGLDDPNRIKNLLGKTANLTFRLVSEEEDDFGSETLFFEDGTTQLRVSKRIVMSGDNLTNARPTFDNLNNETVVTFTLDRVGANKFGRIKETFHRKIYEKYFNNGSDVSSPIFILGMPRSGTTLVEQILSSHNKIFGAGELNFLRQVTTKFFVLGDKLNNQKIIEEINSSNNILNFEYYKLINYLKIKESIITDKAPQNYIWIGFIKYFFPNAKIIHCCRNKKDVLLSIYKNNFGSSDMDWSYDPGDIVRYYNLYSDLIKFWKYKFEKFIYDLSYEKLVTDSENQIKKLLDYCSLEWDKNCLNHHKYSKTAIQTVSISQARKPIYKSSVNSSEIYSKYLDNYFKILDNF